MSSSHLVIDNKSQSFANVFSQTKVVWSFLTLREILNLSATSKQLSSIIIPSDVLKGFSFGNMTRIPFFFGIVLNSAELRSNIATFYRKQDLSLINPEFSFASNNNNNKEDRSINDSNFIQMLSIGEGGKTEEGYVNRDGSIPIQRNIEAHSFDEYDDFTPTHPQPRDKTHRRGNSYFNSDIENHANKALDLHEVAELALNMENLPPLSCRDVDQNNYLQQQQGKESSQLLA